MGGYGSGRSNRGAEKVDGLIRLDIRSLLDHDFQSFPVFDLIWYEGGDQIARVACENFAAYVRLKYTYGREVAVSQNISLSVTKPNFGGSRDWFACPSCYKNCRYLYLYEQVGCQSCARLVYPSQYDQFRVTGEARARSVRDKIGVAADFEIASFVKPKGMHWTKYRKLEKLVWNADVEFERFVQYHLK